MHDRLGGRFVIVREKVGKNVYRSNDGLIFCDISSGQS